MGFEKFMDKVLRPGSGDEDAASAGRSEEEGAREPMSDEQFERHLVERMNALLDEAAERKALHVFADVAAWKLAALGYGCGPAAVGNVLRLFGGYLEKLVEAERAQREAQEARKDVRLPN